MLTITARTNNSTSRNCARCFTPGEMSEMENVKTHRGSEHTRLFFHPECYEKYQYAKLCIQKGVSGIEIDAEGNRINIERVLSDSNKFKETRELSRLAYMLKDIANPEEWVKNYIANKEAV